MQINCLGKSFLSLTSYRSFCDQIQAVLPDGIDARRALHDRLHPRDRQAQLFYLPGGRLRAHRVQFFFPFTLFI